MVLIFVFFRPCNNRPIPLAYATTKYMDTERMDIRYRDTGKIETKCMDTEKIETKCMDTEKIETKCMYIEKMKKRTEEVEKMWYPNSAYPKSSHRDGAIYRNRLVKREFSEADITNRNESKWFKGKSVLVFSLSLYPYS